MPITPDPYQQCLRCVMDTSDPEITFDNRGYCNHCTDYFENVKLSYQGEGIDKPFADLIKKIKHTSRHKKYDCLLGISGGADSCYTAYLLKKWGLRVLLVHMDNGWDSELSVINIKKVIEKLGFDYQSYVLDWEEFRDLQLSFLKASVVEVETPTDVAIPGSLHEVADKYGIKYIMWGGNVATEGILPHMWHYDAKDTVYLKAIQKQFGKLTLKNFPLFGYWKEIYYKFVKRIHIVYPLDHIHYSKQMAVKLLKDEFDWKEHGGKHYESKFTEFVHSYLLPVKFNLDYRRATLSTQICAGEVSREDALAQLKSIAYNPDKLKADIEYICKKLNISVVYFESILNALPKTYRDYPNNERKLRFIYTTYKRFFSKKKLNLKNKSYLQLFLNLSHVVSPILNCIGLLNLLAAEPTT